MNHESNTLSFTARAIRVAPRKTHRPVSMYVVGFICLAGFILLSVWGR